MDEPADADLAGRVRAVDERVRDAASRAGRDPDEITTIVVTKFHPASLVRRLAALGVRDFGESRHQEASAKAAELDDLDVTWHFVGQLQSNKARRVREYCSVIHSVDREAVVAALGGVGNPVDVFVQVGLSDDAGRGGAGTEDVLALADRVETTPGLSLRGLMTVAPLGVEPRRAFARLRELSERLRAQHPHAASLSMGMSGDFEDAILEGATHLRIGSAITGNRPDRG